MTGLVHRYSPSLLPCHYRLFRLSVPASPLASLTPTATAAAHDSIYLRRLKIGG